MSDHNDAFAVELEAEDTAKADRRLAGWHRRQTDDRALLEKLLTAVAHHKLVVGQAHATDADLSLWVTATAIAKEADS